MAIFNNAKLQLRLHQEVGLELPGTGSMAGITLVHRRQHYKSSMHEIVSLKTITENDFQELGGDQIIDVLVSLF